MAVQGIPCSFGDSDHAAEWIVTKLSNGETFTLCEDDFVPGMVPVIAAALGVEWQPLYKAIEKHLAAEGKRAARELAAAEAAEEALGELPPEQRPGINRDGSGPTAAEAIEQLQAEEAAEAGTP
jgi:hypothetical protein